MTETARTPVPPRRTGEHGFTLVELLIVIVVLGILSGITLFGLARFRSDANAAACKADLATVNVAADAYDARTGSFPANVAALVSGGYLRSTPSGTYTFNATTKTVTRDPACPDDTAGGAHTGVTGTVVGVGSGKCVAVAGNSPADGAVIQLATCNGDSGQQWTMPPAYPGALRSLGKCLDVTGGSTANRTYLQLRSCDGTGGQLWALDPSGDLLTNPQSGRCFDAENATTNDGTRLIIWDCHGNSNQRWTLP